MSVIVVNTPNLATELAEIVSIRANIALNAPTTFDTLIKMADKGVYAAKKDGKNCVRTLN